MKFWQSIFQVESDQMFDVVRLSESVGMHGVLISDHLLHPEKQDSTYLYSEDGKPPTFSAETHWPDSWSLAAALAAVTSKLYFCTNVFILPLRHPIEVAKATGSVSFYSGGRLMIGAGAGWMKEEFDMLGVDWATRGKRYDECIEVIRKLQSGGKGEYAEHHGEFFDFPRIVLEPKPATPVPILIGGASGPALRRAARLGDGWISPPVTVNGGIEKMKAINKMRADYGMQNRPFDSIIAVWGEELTTDGIKQLEDAGATGIVSFPWLFTYGRPTSLDEKRAYLEKYAETVMAKFQ
ncbi:TIGR03619 family F420-dependent LLM class oxidoreductase [Denitratisoma oestradiolicum]|uniref:Luciferase-like domain-containing protein n=1 Tax=Denitratisoma oestradiolicum TaxID=311182 RepID=A0A6S6XZK4_9PROT|nr:TIGR03619 family F420-dependent LLM class oxidoreductase [Denitratisoma oestradiolicum]TWO79009.1 hypothetical protein CBW56_16930 [Denitratisoma oestradiolicum]CAB1368332.1 conserved protein of unknown function [Denitratisoma oestradiolicum]